METLIDNLPRILAGFRDTLYLLAASGVAALVVGVVLATMRVSPVPVLRAVGTGYVTVFRNVPLVVLFLITILASFAIADMSNVGSGRFGSGGNDLVRVGDEQITARDIDSAMRRLLTQARQQNPEASYATIANQFDPLYCEHEGRLAVEECRKEDC